jgi:RNA polymerase sigma-54 factor
MKQSLQFRTSQQLSLTPQLQQSIKLLQMSSAELEQEIANILEDNPLLECEEKEEGGFSSPTITMPSRSEGEDITIPEPASEAVSSSEEDALFNLGRWEEHRSYEEDDAYEYQEVDVPSLHEHLLAQLKVLNLSNRDQAMMTILLDAINDDGYLEESLEDIRSILPHELEIEPIELETALKHIQNLDPPGIGARNLSECLLLQLRHETNRGKWPSKTLSLALKIASDHLDLLATRDFTKLKKVLSCEATELKDAQQLLTTLNPRPAANFTKLDEGHFIQHEIVVKKIRGHWIASLNEDAVPKLRINQLYANLLKKNKDQSNLSLNHQLQEAKWMIKNIQQRFSTILSVAQTIVDYQSGFFEHGEVAMRPMVLREIADLLGLHESTISRVTTRKYMLTPRGIFELKYFFGSHLSTEKGGACSTTAIRALIKQMISEENPKKPFSDNRIAEILSQEGIIVARRTIAKYREGLGIPPANQRKSL